MKVVFKGKWLEPIKEMVVNRLSSEFKDVDGEVIFYGLNFKKGPYWNKIAGFSAPGFVSVEPSERYRGKLNCYGFNITLRMGEEGFEWMPFLLEFVVQKIREDSCYRCGDVLSEVYRTDDIGNKFCRECAEKLSGL